MERLVAKAQEHQMQALALTDHGNMYGAMHFFELAKKKGIKPIIGCEFYCVEDRFDRTDRKRYHLILLAKDEKGYQNLSKLSSL
ncbi:MAG TPA: PHP domain-containing protein, partial [Methanocorpusculum sp.]|nr:PHP domain-containing protein [Methanocorpusculum sp.]